MPTAPLQTKPTERAGETDREILAFGALTPEAALAQASVGAGGLGDEEVLARREKYGPNEVGRAKRVGLLMGLFERCKNPLVVQLLIIATAMWFLRDKENPNPDILSAVIVVAMALISVILSYVQETRSNKAVEKLIAMVKTTTSVMRSGKEVEVPLGDLVPGDIVVLAAGSIIPADLRLLSAKDFFVSQAALTGESMPIEKTFTACETTGKTSLDLANACFQGSNVLSGTARGLVVTTGMRTYFGSISQKLAGQRVLTSFDKGVTSFTWLMIRFMVVMVTVVFLIQGMKDFHWLHFPSAVVHLLRALVHRHWHEAWLLILHLRNGQWGQAFLFALSVAVGLTPEMLPMIVTVNLSKGAIAMSRKKVITKRLNAIQNFGAMNILCTDKTGTLTQDRVVLEKYVDVTNKESEDVLRYAYMNSHYQTGLKNLLDVAILSHSDLDVERSAPKIDEIPFDFQRRRMSVVIEYEGDNVLICKGAVEEVFKVCSRYQVDDDIYPLIDMLKKDLMEEYEALSADGYRVLAIAYRDYPRTKTVFAPADETDLILLGYIAFFDPPKDSAGVALEALRKAGVSTKILTGDNALVTQKVCRDVGLPIDKLVTGDQLVGLTDAQLTEIAEKANVFARLSPVQKDQIIRALQRGGHVVGFMGDGINDAPAMKTADVGISVDTAVDVAKESADIILLEKSLLVLDDGIVEGRKVFGNIIKYIKMGASSNFGNMFSMTGASILLKFLPMESIQILVNNLLYDFSQLAIPTDKVDEEYLLKPRKWNIGSIKRFMIWLGPTSSVFDYTTYFLMLYVFNCIMFDPDKVYEAGTDPKSLFQTAWFVESLMTQTLVVHIIRTNRIPFFQSRASVGLSLTTIAVMAAAAIIPFIPPLQRAFKLVPLPASFFGWLALTLVLYCALAHFVKTLFIRKYGAD